MFLLLQSYDRCSRTREPTKSSLAITWSTLLHYSLLSCLYRLRDDARLRAVRFREMSRAIFVRDRLLFDLVISLNQIPHDENRATKFLTRNGDEQRSQMHARGVLERLSGENLQDLYMREN